MFKNYLKTAWRNLKKNTLLSSINILGLTIGITVCLMIFLFILNEFSFDNFHKDGDRIHRVMRGFKNDGKSMQVGYLSGMYAPALANDFKQELNAVLRVSQTDHLVTIGDHSFHEKKSVIADSDFFRFFSFSLLKGDAATVLKNPNSVVLTEQLAIKYFGSADQALGKTILLDKELPLQVTGIANNVAPNSHLDFELVVPLDNYKDAGWMTTWINNGIYTYIKLAPGVTKSQIEQQLPAFMEKYMGADMRKYGFDFTLSLDALKDTYFNTASRDGLKHGDKSIVYIFLSIAVLILLIACINFVNLSTIRAAERSKEVGLRKVLGALRNNLVWQFMGESVLLACISCVLSVGILFVVLPWYQQLLGYSFFAFWTSWPIYAFLLAVILLAGFLAGSYPALFLSAFSPIQALKGKLRLGRGGAAFRQALVVVQFSISVFLIIGTFVITKQMNYVKNKQLGYDKDQTMVIQLNNNEIRQNMNSFKSELQKHSRVQSVSMMSGEPGGYFDGHMFEVEDYAGRWHARTEFADYDFVETIGLRMIAGRNFSTNFPSDTKEAVLINQTAAAKLGWSAQEAVGKWIENTTRDVARRKIIGVVNDFNFQSLKTEIEPLVIAPNFDRRVALIKLTPGSLNEAVALVEKEYAKAAVAYPFEFSFLDQQFDELYKKDIRQQTVLTVFAMLAIFVACLGLFGLASFAAIKRFKEIGVRKVLGASVQNLVLLLSRDLLKPVLLATCIALPAGYWIMHKWLESFAYKTSLSWWVFALAALVIIGVAFVTVALKAFKTAIMNPAKSLRS